MNAESPTLRHVIMKMANVNDTERILKAAREKQKVIYKGPPLGYQLIFLQKLQE